MSDPRRSLQKRWENNRFENFGNVIISMHVQGFRSHSSTYVEIKSPITAFCGLNGTGKSTLLQLAAVAYIPPDRDKRYYVNSFIQDNRLDTKPFAPNAKVEYHFLQPKETSQVLTISRSEASRWNGYQRRPEREVLFAGVSFYIPKVEQRDFIVRKMSKWNVVKTEQAGDTTRQWISKVLSYNYQTVEINTVTYESSEGDIVSLNRRNTVYSEAHMGYGEGRTSALVAALETLPERSLILIEEPEMSLHPSAQYELGHYLVDVATRRKHQIMMTTHSEYILKALPSESHIYLHRENDDIFPIYGLTTMEANSLLSAGHDKAMQIIVEDECAKAILTEMIRRVDPNFLTSVEISPVGKGGGIGASDIINAMRTINRANLVVAAVLDGDQAQALSALREQAEENNEVELVRNIYTLPGSDAPEKELFGSEQVRQHFQDKYRINMSDLEASLGEEDHHNWFKELARQICKDETALLYEAAEAYVPGVTESRIAELVGPLRGSIR